MFERSVVSPEGKWIAAIGFDPARPSGSSQQRRLVIIRPSDGYYRWLDTGTIYPQGNDMFTSRPCFTADGKSLLFSGRDYMDP
ncbi:MAG: hypothetical protein JRJ56_07355, partial [Deltaproteobacteria bacterium]|nr:hypothetical protein [Deltaproteobacteria bacterium]